ncbi:hypothetical protein L3X38_043634 [Prunus dulcis]|uniref:Disease resistance protein RPS4B/Roq1-like leucine-rich repeats domain-containing protein n=1 Tax=Prunus dulcis TaxID=3755 RepID=A0AAD4UY57_PRUDU|nr:hypothetical protein L3X38_043634 [Prunus dulcis]
MVGTKIEVFPSSECLYYLNTIRLLHCKRLVSLPPSILKLKSFYELDLTGCSEFEDFPEIWEPMGHLKVLLLNGTAVKELPSSIECLFGLTRIGLKICKRLVSLPPSILKLKSLYGLDLTGCSEFEDFPEIWEPMGHLKFLLLNGTAVKELPSSIKRLFALLRIGLKNRKRLVSLPPSICKLKSLKELDLTGCFEFEDLPEILEPMGELEFLGLERTVEM